MLELEPPAIHSPKRWRRVNDAHRGITFGIALATLLLCGLIAIAFFGNAHHLGLGLLLVTPVPTLLLSLMERFTPPAGPRKSAGRWLLHLQIILTRSIAGGLLAFLIMPLFINSRLNLGLIDLKTSGTYGLIGLIALYFVNWLATDFFFYWGHRCMHRVPFLWAHHKMHHMDEAFDAATGGRQHWLEDFIWTFFMALPMMILFKFDKFDSSSYGIAFAVITTLLGGIAYINHSNFRLQYGKASVLFISPQTHRIHHSRLPQHLDKNFCAHWPIWDILFGTYFAPARDEFPPTGVDGEREIESLGEALIFTPREWWRMLRAWRSRGDAVAARLRNPNF